ncbi:MAG: sensor histidine kinase [Flammeovirgaceae bacterium]
MLRDKRYWIYHVFATLTISCLLAIEDWLEGDLVGEIMLEFLIEVPVFLLAAAVLSFIAFHVVKWFNKIMPWDHKPFNRFISESGTVVAIVICVTSVTVAVYRLVYKVSSNDNDFAFEIHSLIMFFIMVYMLFVFHEFISVNQDNRLLKLKSEMLLKQNYLTKYEALRNQVNPHFLFNSLNVLSSLVYIDAKKADQFIKKFSDVFRYVLELNQEKLVPVKQELRVLDAYLFLQKIRYGSQLCVHTKVSGHLMDLGVPPLTLQLTVENVLKHNAISNESVLDIWIEAKGDELIITNTYQCKGTTEESTGIGQRNILEKYRLLGERIPSFYLENGNYVVRLPLLV